MVSEQLTQRPSEAAPARELQRLQMALQWLGVAERRDDASDAPLSLRLRTICGRELEPAAPAGAVDPREVIAAAGAKAAFRWDAAGRTAGRNQAAQHSIVNHGRVFWLTGSAAFFDTAQCSSVGAAGAIRQCPQKALI